MRRRTVLLGGVAALALAGAGASGMAFRQREMGSERRGPIVPVSAEEHARTIAAMRPPKRARPVVAVVGQNDGTETTDYIIPYAVLRQSGVADVLALATEDRPLKFMPALAIRPQATTSAFDRQYPDGADCVVVPAIHHREHPDVVGWIQTQAEKGATIIGICSGVKTLSAAGLLAGRSATGHWHDVEDLRRANPTMSWARDRRYVADRGVVTTTGVSASLPASLALVEAIAGRERALALAGELGVAAWDATHDSGAFRLSGQMIGTAAGNRLAFWNRDTWSIPVADGIDEIALAFTADAWSRTYRSHALTAALASDGMTTRRGLTLIPDEERESAKVIEIDSASIAAPATALSAALAAIAKLYGERTASFVALQLEHPWSSDDA